MTTTARRATVLLPEPTHSYGERSAPALVGHSLVHTKRLLRTWLRTPGTIIQTVIYPILTMLMLRIVLGDSISAATGQPSIYGTVPMISLIAAMTGAMVSALGLSQERSSGLLGRFATMPVHPASGLIGRLLAEGLRVFVTTVCIVIAGLALGFRFNNGPLAALALLGLPVLFGMGFATLIVALAANFNGLLVVNVVSIVTTLLMFFNSGFVPVAAYPTWLQDVVAHQPMSCAVDAMKGLSLGGPVADSLWQTLAWSLGFFVVFIGPAVWGYRRAAQTGA
ncbi:MAG: ABC transporter permease [Aldersonia sp.]|nr:ABC transporter permease [Aldersonia sp.]